MIGFLVGGTASGVGKTTVTLALIAALRARGLVVQAFKGGPDFLDTQHLTRVSGRQARNLDTWMLDADANRDVFAQAAAGADAAVAEGMMGLFDGKDALTETGSSAEIAKLLGLPVVLVVDAGKSARSVAAVVLGFESFDPQLRLAGVVLNRVAGERHFQLLADAIRARCRTPVLGWLPKEPAVTLQERHLGVQQAFERDDDEAFSAALVRMAEAHLDLDAILKLQAPAVTAEAPVLPPVRVRIGVARDAAFSFYYEDNLDLLRQNGAEIVPFSPLADQRLPEDLDGLYLGGGYPELHAERLSGNTAMAQALREFAGTGRPVYAECGGMIYLAQSLRTADGTEWPMAGVLPLAMEMTPRLVDFGYATVTFTRDCLLGPAGTLVRGHSFHYSRITQAEAMDAAYEVEFSRVGKRQAEGFQAAGVLASYVHLHFRAQPAVAGSLVEAAATLRYVGVKPSSRA